MTQGWYNYWSLLLKVATVLFLMIISCQLNGCGTNQIAAPDGPESFSFCVIGDRTGTHEPGVFKKVVDAALDEDSDFLIDCGDMIEGGTVKWFILQKQWLEYMKLIEDISIPFYHTPGNHDNYFEGQMIQYLQYAGLTYYSFDCKSIHVVVLDNSKWYIDSSWLFPQEQLLWLYEDLNNNNSKFTMIFFHKPFWDMYLTDSTLNNSLHDYFIEMNVTAVFAGHYHNHFSTEYDGVKYTIVGRSGGGSTYNHPDFTSHDPRYVRSKEEYHSFEKVTVSDSVIIQHNNLIQVKFGDQKNSVMIKFDFVTGLQ